MTRAGLALFAALVVACTGGAPSMPRAAGPRATAPAGGEPRDVGSVPSSSSGTLVREPPPAVGAARDVHLPAIARSALPNGLELDVVEYHQLPVLHLRLVVRGAGSASDPQDAPGLAAFAGDMLLEGTRSKTSAQVAEEIEFVGGTMEVTTTPDATTVAVSVLSEHAETALNLLGEIAAEPTFPQVEVDRLRRRELDRLTQDQNEPAWLSRRAFFREVYGAHPYARFDATPESLRRIARPDVAAFHAQHYRAGSMYLVAVGDVRPAEFRALAARALGRVARGTAPAARIAPPPEAASRTVVIVDRPGSAQSVIRIGNVALRRADEDFVPLAVANMVLGAEPSSRLFMDLRERRSLTYGAYSRVYAGVEPGTFQASGSVRTEVTGRALAAFFEHLDRIVRDPVPEAELNEARQFLTASFPLAIETPADVARLVSDLRLYGLPDAYWDGYRARIAQVDAAQSLRAAQRYVRPDRAVVVIVGAASQFENDARRFGPVRVVDAAGRTLRELPAL